MSTHKAGRIWTPPPTTRWLLAGRTRWPQSVVTIDQKPDLVFGQGRKNRKLGKSITKGAWAGMPIYMLTLEERVTCPPCAVWDRCYGNSMRWARRVAHGEALEARIAVDLAWMDSRHTRGFAVRLHQLGDFYSLRYVELWTEWIDRFPRLHVFGFTAWRRDSEIGAAIWALTRRRWDRFAIRFSGYTHPQGAVVVPDEPAGRAIEGGLICPEQLGKTKTCGTCGLCWNEHARDTTIVFIEHGPRLPTRNDETP